LTSAARSVLGALDRLFGGNLRPALASLRIRNFRIFVAAQAVSLNGTWMQRIAQYWLVLHLTRSGLALGLTAAFQSLPVLLFGVWGGLVADRVDKRRLLVATQAVSGILGLVLAVLTFSGAIDVWMVYLLALCLGGVQALDIPVRQSFMMEMVGHEHIGNAIGLNSSVVTSSRMIGPALAGVVVALVGSAWCFLVNGLSFFAVVAGLLSMRPSELHRHQPVSGASGQIREGLRYAWSHRELRIPLSVLVVIGMFAWNWNVVLPLFASYTFHAGAGTYGAMMSVVAVGSFVGAAYAATRGKPSHRRFAAAAICVGISILIVSVAPSLPFAYAALVPMGTALFVCQTVGTNILQVYTADEFRGRVMSFYVIAFVGTTPIGTPILGWVAQSLGPRAALGFAGCATLVAALFACKALVGLSEVALRMELALKAGDEASI
jgi:MFS family permease